MKCEVIRCDVCGIEKKEVNHWYKIYLLDRNSDNKPSGILVMDFEINSLTLWIPWPETKPLPEVDAHVCGRECASKALSSWMADGKIDFLRVKNIEEVTLEKKSQETTLLSKPEGE